MKRKVFLMIIFVIIFVCVCSDSNNSMTKIDKEFNEYANEAAEKFLKKLMKIHGQMLKQEN